MHDPRYITDLMPPRRSHRSGARWFALGIPMVFGFLAVARSGTPGEMLAVLAGGLAVVIGGLGLRSLQRSSTMMRATRPRTTTRRNAPQQPVDTTPVPPLRASSERPRRGESVLPTDASLGDVLVKLRGDYSELAASRHVALDFRMHGGLDRAPIDIEVLTYVLAHLVENALRHAPNGTVIEIRATPARDGRTARITVTDDGEGVPADRRDALFTTPVFASGASDETILRGWSLVRCRERLEKIGGGLTYEPAAPRGSRFAMAIPIDASAVGARHSRAADTAAG